MRALARVHKLKHRAACNRRAFVSQTVQAISQPARSVDAYRRETDAQSRFAAAIAIPAAALS